MESVFLKLLNMSITASWLVLAVLLLRLLLKKAPKYINCILWAFVAVRLIFPFSIESVLSLIPSSEPLPEKIIYTAHPTVNSGIPIVDNAINPVISQSLAPQPLTSINPTQVISFIASWVWVIGMAVMAVYTFVTYLRIRFKVREAVILRDNIYLCDSISTPFILGIVRPKVYLPSSIDETEAAHVISHERSHLKRRDHWWKPLGFLLLSVYWFNPVMWLAYILLCRDIELACDERVIRDMDIEDKKAYTHALLNCSIPRRMIAACPLAFGEVGVKSRVKNALSYKKPAFWIIIAALVICAITAVCFLTNPKSIKLNELTDAGDYSRIFENVYHIDILTPEHSLSAKESGDIERIIEQLEKVKIKKSPVSDNRSEERDSTNRIIINNTVLCFNGDFTEYWVNDDVKPTLTYTVASPSKAKAVFDFAAELLSGNDYMSGADLETPICWVNNKDDYVALSKAGINESSAEFLDYGDTLNGEIAGKLAIYYKTTMPLFKFESTDEIAEFISKFEKLYSFDLRYQKYPSFIEMVSVYDDEFFKDNVLFIASIDSFDPNEYPVLSDIYNNGENLVLNFTADNDYEKRMLNMTNWFICVELEREYIAGCTAFDCFLNYNVKFTERDNHKELDHEHKLATESNVVDDPDFTDLFCGTGLGTASLSVNGKTYSVSESQIYDLTDILSNLEYSEEKRCDCEAPYRIQGGVYSFNLELAFARTWNAQVDLTAEQVFALNKIINNIIKSEEWRTSLYPENMNSYESMSVYETTASDGIQTVNIFLSEINSHYYISSYIEDTLTSQFISSGQYDYVNGDLTLYDTVRSFIYVFKTDKNKETLSFDKELSSHYDYDKTIDSLFSDNHELKLTDREPYYVNGKKTMISDIDFDSKDEYCVLFGILENGKVTKYKLSIWSYDESLPLSEIAVEGKELATLTFPAEGYYHYFDYDNLNHWNNNTNFLLGVNPEDPTDTRDFRMIYRNGELYFWADNKRVEW